MLAVTEGKHTQPLLPLSYEGNYRINKKEKSGYTTVKVIFLSIDLLTAGVCDQLATRAIIKKIRDCSSVVVVFLVAVW